MNNKFFAELLSPSTQYRAKPFWSWNGHLEEKELLNQIQVMHKMGFGGFFMHSRTGLDIPYLADRWFELVEFCVKQAKNLDMEAWLYDEDRWPSGSAGGKLTCKPEHRRKYLVMEELEKTEDLGNYLAIFTGKLKDKSIFNIQRIKANEKVMPSEGQKIFAFRIEEPPHVSWYNGYTYCDTLSHETVKEFIKITHEKYHEHLGEYFGNTIPGIFTDEPNHGPKLLAGDLEQKNPGLPWTPKLLETFQERYGYDLLDHLPELFYDLEGQAVSQARYHYHDCVTFLFVDAYARQTGQWCKDNNISFTGHILDESPLSRQAATVGSCMRFYEHMQVPGMDILTQHKREFDTAKQVSSAARQFGADWRLSETYGCTGWDFSFAGHKALGDWQAALGINLRCHHLLHYTLEGFAKRDYPGSIFYQSPWWEYYSHVEDYFSRIHVAMTRGKEVRDLLVIHPIESMWLKCRTDWENSSECKQLDYQLMELRDTLLGNNIDFDYADEEILSRHAVVKQFEGKAQFTVAQADYKAILVPPLTTIRSSTLELLEEFADAGGLVIFSGTIAEYVDALKSSAAKDVARKCDHFLKLAGEAIDILAKTCRRVSITDGDNNQLGPVLQLLREDDDAFYLFLCNTGEDFQLGDISPGVYDRKQIIKDARISGFSQCKGKALEVDLRTGKVFEANSSRIANEWQIMTDFPEIGTRLFIIPKEKQAKHFAQKSRYITVGDQNITQNEFSITLSEYNNLPLDRPRWKMAEGEFAEQDYILNIDDRVREKLGIALRDGMQVQPWKQKSAPSGKSSSVMLEYSFQVKDIPEDNIFLAIEKPDLYKITINGKHIDNSQDTDWWMDKSLRLVKFSREYLRQGENKFHLEVIYNSLHPGLETVFLIGNFGVSNHLENRFIEALPSSLKIGDWTKQGLAFYSGLLTYHMSAKINYSQNQRVILKIPRFCGTAVVIKVNGMDAGILGWEPYELDITELINNDDIQIAIQLLGHRRNSHGPLHHKTKNPPLIGPGEFIDDGENWCADYRLAECGLLDYPQFLFREKE